MRSTLYCHKIMMNESERKQSYRSIVDAYTGPIDMARVSMYAIEAQLTHPETLAMRVELGLDPPGTVEKHYPLPMPVAKAVMDSCDERYFKEKNQ